MLRDQEKQNKQKPVRVYIDGCFDLAHYGHANAIRQASLLGDELCVGVHSDEVITKQKGKPIFSQEERYKLIRAIKWVTEVIEDAPYSFSVSYLDQLGCDFAAHGNDPCISADGRNVYEEAIACGRYREFQRTEGVSTTDLVNRILDRFRQFKEYEEQWKRAMSETESSQMRRAHSIDSVVSTGIDLLSSSKTQRKLSVKDSAAKTTETGPADWSTCGMSYMPNAVRISQFCMDQTSLSGFRDPQPGDVVVYVPGAYDLFHVGHVCFFEKCLELGNYLLVGLHSDKNSSFESGYLGTIMTLQERMLSVLACRYVNNVILDAPYEIPGSLLDRFKVDYVVVGMDTKLMPTPNGEDPMRIPKQRGIFRRVDSGSPVTTTSVIRRILNNHLHYEERNKAKREKDLMVTAPTSNHGAASAIQTNCSHLC